MLIVDLSMKLFMDVIATLRKLWLSSVNGFLSKLKRHIMMLKMSPRLSRRWLKMSLSNDMKSKSLLSKARRLTIQSMYRKRSRRRGMTTQNGWKLRSLQKTHRSKRNRKSWCEIWKMRQISWCQFTRTCLKVNWSKNFWRSWTRLSRLESNWMNSATSVSRRKVQKSLRNRKKMMMLKRRVRMVSSILAWLSRGRRRTRMIWQTSWFCFIILSTKKQRWSTMGRIKDRQIRKTLAEFFTNSLTRSKLKNSTGSSLETTRSKRAFLWGLRH